MNIRLIAAHEFYAELFLKWRHEEIAVKYNPYKPLSLEEIRLRLRSSVQDLHYLNNGQEICWLVEVDGQIVGHVSLHSYNSMMLTAEIGYQITQNHQGRGIGKQAVKLFVTKVFAQTQIRKISAYVHEENIASCKLLERIGFKREGLLREHYLIQGNPVNEVFYGLLRSDVSF